MKQTIGMMDLEVSRYSFRTKPAFVHRKVIAWLDADYVIVFHEQVHSTLDRAIRAVCGDDAIDHPISAPTVVGCVVKMRAIRLDDLVQMFNFTHEVSRSMREP